MMSDLSVSPHLISPPMMSDFPITVGNSVRALDVEDGLWRTAQIIEFNVVGDNICAKLQWILTS